MPLARAEVSRRAFDDNGVADAYFFNAGVPAITRHFKRVSEEKGKRERED